MDVVTGARTLSERSNIKAVKSLPDCTSFNVLQLTLSCNLMGSGTKIDV